jgi:hypothetical protein
LGNKFGNNEEKIFQQAELQNKKKSDERSTA